MKKRWRDNVRGCEEERGEEMREKREWRRVVEGEEEENVKIGKKE